MKKISIICAIIALLIVVTSCDSGNPYYVAGGTVTAVVSPTPLPITGNVTASATIPTPLPVNIDGVTINDGAVPSVPYYYQIADGQVAGHVPWTKISFTPAMTTTESDIWSAGGLINFPTSAQQMQVLSSNNTDDIAATLFSGTSSGGSTTTLVDVTKNFTAGTPVAAGDVILLKTTMAYGFVTGVTATTLTCSEGFGGVATSNVSGASQAYAVIDDSNTVGGHAVLVEYLDASYNTGWEFVVLNGTTAVNTVSTSMYRVNSFRIVATGSNKKATGNLTIRNTAGTTVFSYITAGYTRARNSAYTVPAGYTLYITQFVYSFGYAANQTHYARIYGRASQNNNFKTDGIFYPFAEVVCANSDASVNLDLPTKLIQKVDLKVSGIATATGTASAVLRGWLEAN